MVFVFCGSAKKQASRRSHTKSMLQVYCTLTGTTTFLNIRMCFFFTSVWRLYLAGNMEWISSNLREFFQAIGTGSSYKAWAVSFSRRHKKIPRAQRFVELLTRLERQPVFGKMLHLNALAKSCALKTRNQTQTLQNYQLLPKAPRRKGGRPDHS